MRTHIDLNADLGEGCGDDAAIMKIVTRCNIACGGHAGDARSMAEALSLAKHNGVAAGAHPSYPDRENFGRSQMALGREELRQTLSEQIQALKSIADNAGIQLEHVKPHGALYNFAAQDLATAKVIAETTASLLPGGALLGPPESKLSEAANAVGIAFLGEAFADRAYEQDGSLRSRSKPGALLAHETDCTAQAMQIVLDGSVTTYDGEQIPMQAQTICMHSDTPGALVSARLIRDTLEASGVKVSAHV